MPLRLSRKSKRRNTDRKTSRKTRRKTDRRKLVKKLRRNMKRSKVNTSKRNNRRTTVRRRMMGGMEAAAPAAGAAAGAAGALNRRLENLTERDEIRKYINMLKDEINTKLGEPPSGTVLFLKGNTKHVKTAFENEELILEMSKACVILNDGDEIQEGGHFVMLLIYFQKVKENYFVYTKKYVV